MSSADRLAADPPLTPEETRRRAAEHACATCDHQGWMVLAYPDGHPAIYVCDCMSELDDDLAHDIADDQRICQLDVARLPEAQSALAAAVRRQILAEGPEREDYEDR